MKNQRQTLKLEISATALRFMGQGAGGGVLGLVFALGASLCCNLASLLGPSAVPAATPEPAASVLPAQTAALRRLTNSLSRLEQTVEDQCGCDAGGHRPETRAFLTVKVALGSWLAGLVTAVLWACGACSRCARACVPSSLPTLPESASSPSTSSVGVPVKRRKGTVLT